jgi:hypothetical protein
MGATSCQNVTPSSGGFDPPPPHAAADVITINNSNSVNGRFVCMSLSSTPEVMSLVTAARLPAMCE